MNILMVYPEFPDTFWSFKHALKFISKKASSPPLGLLTVAAMLPAEWQKRLVDLNVSRLTEKDLAYIYEWTGVGFSTPGALSRAACFTVYQPEE